MLPSEGGGGEWGLHIGVAVKVARSVLNPHLSTVGDVYFHNTQFHGSAIRITIFLTPERIFLIILFYFFDTTANSSYVKT